MANATGIGMESVGVAKKQEMRGRRLVLVPCPLQGHINPMLQLATLLHSKGFSITILHTHFNYPNTSNYPHFTFQPMSDGLSDSGASITDVIALLSLLNLNCVNHFRDCLVQLLAQEPITCIISDAIMYFTQAVAESLELPRIALRTTSAVSFVVFASFPLLQQKGYLPIQEAQLEEEVLEQAPLKVKDLPLIPTHNPETLYQLVDHMVNETRRSSGVIWNSFESLEQSALEVLQQDLSIPVFPIGPFHRWASASSSSLLTQDHSCISWLDTQAPNSVIYVSFGSLAAMDETHFLETAWGLANSEQPFLWVVRTDLVKGSTKWDVELLLPHDFHENVSGRGFIVKWAPQQEVLAHAAVGGFWTHNGWNSTLESICEGVPMICWPCFGDQKVNARYVSQVWRVGLQLENGLERGDIERCIRKLMGSKEREEMMVRVKDLKEKADLCLREGGSSFKSQQSLIDLILSL